MGWIWFPRSLKTFPGFLPDPEPGSQNEQDPGSATLGSEVGTGFGMENSDPRKFLGRTESACLERHQRLPKKLKLLKDVVKKLASINKW
jgi:hypothetical protein